MEEQRQGQERTSQLIRKISSHERLVDTVCHSPVASPTKSFQLLGTSHNENDPENVLLCFKRAFRLSRLARNRQNQAQTTNTSVETVRPINEP